MVAECECGNTNCKNLQTVPVWRLKFHTSHAALQSGTRLSIGCFVTYPRIGKANLLLDARTDVDLIGSTKTTTGLEVICVRDDTEYKLAGKVSDEEVGTISIVKIPSFEAWNYKITPA
jgi:hypothetical protein